MLQEVVFIVDGKPAASLHPRNDRTVLGVGRMLEHGIQLEWKVLFSARRLII